MKWFKKTKGTIGVITLHRVLNFGSALQAYALVRSLESCFPGKICLIDYNPSSTQSKQRDNVFRRIITFLRMLLNGKIYNKLIVERKFRVFLQSIPLSQTLSWSELHRSNPHFEVYITGSDQVWNPKYMGNDFSYLLDFAPGNAMRFAFSSSFGSRMALQKEFFSEYQRLLSKYTRVSVREYSGLEIFRQLTNRSDCKVVLDPTFLLTRNEWDRCIPLNYKTSSMYPSHFILCYFVSYAFSPYLVAEEIIEEISKRYGGYPVLCIGGVGFLGNRVKFIPNAGPFDFLDLFIRADYVITNSFHGTAFAINFKKDFITIIKPQADDDDRVRNLLIMLELKCRGIRDVNDLKNIPLTCDYNHTVNETIDGLREETRRELAEICRQIQTVQ